MFQEAEDFDADDAVDEKSWDDDEENVDGFRKDGKYGFEDFLGKRDLIEHYDIW